MHTSSITLISAFIIFLSFPLSVTAEQAQFANLKNSKPKQPESSFSITNNKLPKRIVSLAPNVTKSLYLLGAQDKLIAVTVFCPAEAASKEKIGTIFEPNIERIVDLSPDLVIAAQDGNTLKSVESLRKLGLTVYVVDTADNFNQICTVFLALAKRIGEEKKAQDIIKVSTEKIARVKEAVKDRKKPSVFWQVGAQPVFAASKNCFVNDFIEFAGGRNVFSEFRSRYPQISREEVISKNPDIIIMVSMGDVTKDEIATWRKFPSLKAAVNNNIYMLDAVLFTNPTPLSIADGVETVAGILSQYMNSRPDSDKSGNKDVH